MTLFDKWAELNDVVGSYRSRFDVLREEMPKCQTRQEVINLLLSEGFYSRYPDLPALLQEEYD